MLSKVRGTKAKEVIELEVFIIICYPFQLAGKSGIRCILGIIQIAIIRPVVCVVLKADSGTYTYCIADIVPVSPKDIARIVDQV